MAAHSVSGALARARAALAAAGCEDPRLEAELLLREALGCSRAWIIAHGDDPVAPDAARRLDGLVARRAGGEPVAHIRGRREFWSMDLAVTAQVLVPRPDTELLVERALAHLAPDAAARMCDAGTGSGAVAIAVARERPRVTVVASDASRAALRVAASNAARHAPGRVALLAADWLAPLAAGAFDLVASNPPYVASGDPHLERGDLRFEPRAALDGGTDGLDAIRTLTRTAPTHLRPGGWQIGRAHV